MRNLPTCKQDDWWISDPVEEDIDNFEILEDED